MKHLFLNLTFSAIHEIHCDLPFLCLWSRAFALRSSFSNDCKTHYLIQVLFLSFQFEALKRVSKSRKKFNCNLLNYFLIANAH